MPKCRVTSVCSEIRRGLRRCGVRREEVLVDCDAQGACSAALTNAMKFYGAVNPDNAETAEQTIRKIFQGTLPIERTTTTFNLAFKRTPFRCPELSNDNIDFFVRQPCSAKSCVFWAPSEWARNCIIYYMTSQNRDHLDLKELSILLYDDVKDIRKRWNRAISISSHNALKVKTEQSKGVDAEPAGQTSGVCATCGAPVPTDKQVIRNDVLYCSRACHDAKPPIAVAIEKEFGLPIRRVLEICRNNFFSRRTMNHALGVTGRQLDTLFAAHQIDISSLE